MKRLAWLPALFLGGCIYGYWSGYAYPILTTSLRPFLLRADAPDYEAEVL